MEVFARAVLSCWRRLLREVKRTSIQIPNRPQVRNILSACMESDMKLGIGDVVLFEITERTDDFIKLKYIKEKGQGEKKFDVRV